MSIWFLIEFGSERWSGIEFGLDLWSGMAGNTPNGGIGWFRAESVDRLLLFYQEIGVGRNHASNGVKPQTAMPKMTAGTVRSFHVFIKNYGVRWYFAVELVFHGKPPLPKLCMVASLHHVFMSHSNQGTVDRMLGHGTGHNWWKNRVPQWHKLQ